MALLSLRKNEKNRYIENQKFFCLVRYLRYRVFLLDFFFVLMRLNRSCYNISKCLVIYPFIRHISDELRLFVLNVNFQSFCARTRIFTCFYRNPDVIYCKKRTKKTLVSKTIILPRYILSKQFKNVFSGLL